MKENAIITFAIGYQKSDVEIFLESSVIHQVSADIYVFAGKNYHQLKKELSGYSDVRVLQYKESFIPKVMGKLFSKLPGIGIIYARFLQLVFKATKRRWVHHFSKPLLHFMSKRFFALDQFVRTHSYKNYLFTDIRDVLFQSDPFKDLLFNEIHSGVEPIKIGADPMNTKWSQFTLSASQFASVKDKEIVCAGVILGSSWSFRRYLKEFITMTYASLSTTINKLGADQAIHSYILHSGLKDVKKRLHDNKSGSIVTLHHEDISKYKWTRESLAHPDGSEISLVHQYDRHPELDKKFKKIYGEGRLNLKLVG